MICTSSCAEISSDTNDRDCSRFLDVLPVVYSSFWAGTWRRHLVVAFEAVIVVKKGYVVGQLGANGGQSGGVDNFSRFLRGYTPAPCGQKGESFCPLQRRGPAKPKNVPEKKTNDVDARHGLRASFQGFGIAFDAGWGTWERLPCARFAYTPKWLKNLGVYPLFTISLNKLSGSRLPGAQIPGWYEYELGNCYSCP